MPSLYLPSSKFDSTQTFSIFEISWAKDGQKAMGVGTFYLFIFMYKVLENRHSQFKQQRIEENTTKCFH